jgi:hypothetical protein
LKDSLPTNDPAKVIKGAEFSTEFTAIQTAFGQAAPIASPTFTGTATFNNITATGTVTLSSVNVNGTVTADGLTVDTNTLYVDALNNRVGVGTTSPGYRLDVYRDSNDNAPALAIRNPNAGASAASRLYMEADGNNFNIYVNGDGTADANITQFSSTAGGSQFAFETAGSEAMRIDAVGNVGIGTASPSAKLEVEDDDFARLDLNLSDASGTTIADVRGLVAGSEKWRLGKTSSSSDDFTINVAGSEALRVDTSGNVGIGSTGPVSRLEVVNSGVASLYVGYNNTSENYYDANTHYFRNGAGTAERARIDSNGNALIGTTTAVGSLGNTARVTGGIFSTNNGTTSVPNSTWTTLTAIPTGDAVYLVTAYLPNSGDPASYNAVSIVTTSLTGTNLVDIKNANQVALRMSGSNLQVNHGQGTTQPINWSILRLA